MRCCYFYLVRSLRISGPGLHITATFNKALKVAMTAKRKCENTFNR